MRKICFTIFGLILLASVASCERDPSAGSLLLVKDNASGGTALKVSPGEKSLPVLQSCALKASVILQDGYAEDISQYGTWTSSNESVATVSNLEGSRGVVKTVSFGNAIITVSFNKLSAAAHITVNQIVQPSLGDGARIVLLHHSVGSCIWAGGVPEWFANYNAQHSKSYTISEQAFPKKSPYGWNNNPYDYWNIWVSHSGAQPFMEEPTLETLTRDNQVVVWKHSFLVGSTNPDTGSPDIRSSEKRIENYKLQYQALKSKMRSFSGTRFLVWTGAALVQGALSEDEAKRAREFSEWVRKQWDEPGDNIYVWDFFELETEGGNFLKAEYAAGANDSHPNQAFSRRVSPFFCKRVVDVVEGRGDSSTSLGQ